MRAAALAEGLYNYIAPDGLLNGATFATGGTLCLEELSSSPDGVTVEGGDSFESLSYVQETTVPVGPTEEGPTRNNAPPPDSKPQLAARHPSSQAAS